ncbi:DUF1348 family protein [Pectobacterium brasiliense]
MRLAEDVWNARNPERVSLAYTHHSFWRTEESLSSGMTKQFF